MSTKASTHEGVHEGAHALIQEIVWFGDIPVAAIRANENGGGIGVFYIHTDHLNTPIKITRSTDNAIVWRWDRDPFGNGAPNEDPDGNALSVKFNLRFPGQYADAETGLYYNYFRDYDPSTGRYVESDPIGLDGGLNTYAYVRSNPNSRIDPSGLIEWNGTVGTISVVAWGGASRYTFELTSECKNGKRWKVTVTAGGFAVGAGATFTGTIDGSVTFKDKLNYIDPFVFEGQAVYLSAGLTLGQNPDPKSPFPQHQRGWSLSCSAFDLGGAHSNFVCGQGGFGLDASVSAGVGYSRIVDMKQEDCCN